MINIDESIKIESLKNRINNVFSLAAKKIKVLNRKWKPEDGAPIFTVNGIYTTRGWTEWTQGFLYGMAIYEFDATGEKEFLDIGRKKTLKSMAFHLSHTGVHDHGFNNISTYGNLLRLIKEGKISSDPWESYFYQLALKISGAVQAARWTELTDELGYIYSFNGPHSLFSDTIRTLRILAVSHILGHKLLGEKDTRISLLKRLLQHAETTARYNVYFGTGRDGYDVRGRVAHESIFNIISRSYCCPSTQQGYSPFTTWTRGHAWVLLGYTELLEFIETLDEEEINNLALPYFRTKKEVQKRFMEVAAATADFYLKNTPSDGIPYWDTGAPNLHKLGNYLDRPADPFNEWEPVDSSASAISTQGLLRLGHYLINKGKIREGERYFKAGLTTTSTLMANTYLSWDENHQGLLLHSVYNYPNRWDHVRKGKKIPNGESCIWGDYHLLELAVYIQRIIRNQVYLTFFNI